MDGTSLTTNTAVSTIEAFLDDRDPTVPQQFHRSWHLP